MFTQFAQKIKEKKALFYGMILVDFVLYTTVDRFNDIILSVIL